METIGTDIWTTFVSSIDIMYIITCNICTYIIIKTIETGTRKKINTWWKRIISALSAIILGFGLILLAGHDKEAIFYSFFVQFLTWDYVLKGILKAFKHKEDS